MFFSSVKFSFFPADMFLSIVFKLVISIVRSTKKWQKLLKWKNYSIFGGSGEIGKSKSACKHTYVAHFWQMLPFLTPLKTSENKRFFDVFGGCKMGTRKMVKLNHFWNNKSWFDHIILNDNYCLIMYYSDIAFTDNGFPSRCWCQYF